MRLRPAFVCSTGGHLTELFLLAPHLEPERFREGLWVTHVGTQREGLLEGREVRYLPYMASRDVHAVLAAVPAAWRILREEQVDVVYSTGAAIALCVLPLALLLRKSVVYVESLARVTDPSLTGRLLALLPGVRLLSQNAPFSRRWEKCVSVLDRYRSVEVDEPGTVARVLVTVGTARPWKFSRLLRRLIDVIPADVEVVWQIGADEVVRPEGDVRPLMTQEEFEAELDAADVVITHGGVGTILTCLSHGTFPVVAPRLGRFKEHVDDHQLQIARVLRVRDLGLVVDAGELTWHDVERAARRAICSTPPE